jgi:hypothetical protein
MFLGIVGQGCTNPWHQIAVATKFLRWLLKFVGPQVQKFFHVTVQAPRTLMRLLDILERLFTPNLGEIFIPLIKTAQSKLALSV